MYLFITLTTILLGLIDYSAHEFNYSSNNVCIVGGGGGLGGGVSGKSILEKFSLTTWLHYVVESGCLFFLAGQQATHCVRQTQGGLLLQP